MRLPLIARPVLAYVLGGTGGTAAFWVSLFFAGQVSNPGHFSLHAGLGPAGLMTGAVLLAEAMLFSTLAVLVAMAPLFLLTRLVARFTGLSGPYYNAVAGAICGFLLGALPHLIIVGLGKGPPIWPETVLFLATFPVAGGIGGWLYWLASGHPRPAAADWPGPGDVDPGGLQ